MNVDMARNIIQNLIKASFKGRFFHVRPWIEGLVKKGAVPNVKSRGRVVQ
jgi:hypothetical protein